MADMTTEELRAKAREVKKRVRSEMRDATTSEKRGEKPIERTDSCPGGCGKEVTWKPVVIDGRALTAIPPHCAECAERRHLLDQEREREQMEESRREAHEYRKRNIKKLLQEAGANPWAHGDLALDEWDTSDAGAEPVEAATRLLNEVRDAGDYDPVRGLYMYGPTGAGKTLLATAVVRELLIDGWSPDTIRMDHAAAFITEVQDCYGSDRSVIDVKQKRENARLWVLDDLGTERPSDDVVRVLTEILNRREGRATFITSNLPPQKIAGRHPELARVVSRLGPRYFEVVEVQGRDRRHDHTSPDSAVHEA